MHTPLADRIRPVSLDDIVGQKHLIGENMPLQHAESGDIIAVCATGAYNFSMSSNYNRLCRPALVFVNNGESRIAVKRQTLDDIICNDLIY